MVYQNASDGITRTTEWDGKVALMYSSDFGFASNYDACVKDLTECGNDNRNNNWLYLSKGDYNEYLLSPIADSTTNVFYVFYNGKLMQSAAASLTILAVRPTLYLTSNTLITSGTGTSYDPYIISLL